MAGQLVLDPNSPFYGQLMGVQAGQQINTDKISSSYGVISPTTPTDTTKITADSLTHAPIIGLPPENPTNSGAADATVAGAITQNTALQAEIAKQTPVQTEAEKLQQSILDSITSDAQKNVDSGAQQVAAEQAAGIPEQKAQFAALNSKILAGNAEYKALKDQYDQASAKIEGQGRGITTAIVTGQQGAIQRQALAALNTKAGEIGLIQAQAQGLQGQITDAQNTVNRAIDLKNKDAENLLAYRQAQLNAILPTLNKEEKIRAAAQQVIIDKEQQALADKKATEKNQTNFLLDLMTKYPDVNISLTDTIAQAQAKVPNSRIFKEATRLVGGGTSGSTGGVSGTGGKGTAGTYVVGKNPAVDSWVNLINSKKATISNVPANLKNAVAEAVSSIQPDTQMPSSTDIRSQATSKSNIEQVSSLLGDSYLNTAVGPNTLARTSLTNFVTGGKDNFIAGVEQLRSQLNLDKLIQSKAQGATFGALSDAELQVLASAGTRLGTWVKKDSNGNVTGYQIGEGDFKKELDKINNFAKLDYLLKGGNPVDIGVQQMGDGTFWTQNNDGTMTQIK